MVKNIFHDANREISGYLFQDEDSNVREREERQRELARLALEAQNKLSAEEQLQKERQEQLDKLIKEAKEAKDEVARLQTALRDANSSISNLTTEKGNVERNLESTKSELERKLESTKNELDGKLTSTRNELEGKLTTARNELSSTKSELDSTKRNLEDEKAMRASIPYGMRSEIVMIMNPVTRCALDGGLNWGNSAWAHILDFNNANQQLKVTRIDSNSTSPWYIQCNHNNRYLELSGSELVCRDSSSGNDAYKRWKFVAQDNGCYYIQSNAEDKIMRLSRNERNAYGIVINFVPLSSADDLCRWTVFRLSL
ncbi:hypothetical protein ABW19_dt0203936 [Dactylella cylindrospora]|nr:hypothetical protein ABW19_dt0203936 [Dactylella cylindrospora]